MKVLVDTHCWLWFLITPNRLSAAAVDALADTANEVYVSAAVAWEIVIKHGPGRPARRCLTALCSRAL